MSWPKPESPDPEVSMVIPAASVVKGHEIWAGDELGYVRVLAVHHAFPSEGQVTFDLESGSPHCGATVWMRVKRGS